LIFEAIFGKILSLGDVSFRQGSTLTNCKPNMSLKRVRLWFKITCKI